MLDISSVGEERGTSRYRELISRDSESFTKATEGNKVPTFKRVKLDEMNHSLN